MSSGFSMSLAMVVGHVHIDFPGQSERTQLVPCLVLCEHLGILERSVAAPSRRAAMVLASEVQFSRP